MGASCSSAAVAVADEPAPLAVELSAIAIVSPPSGEESVTVEEASDFLQIVIMQALNTLNRGAIGTACVDLTTGLRILRRLAEQGVPTMPNFSDYIAPLELVRRLLQHKLRDPQPKLDGIIGNLNRFLEMIDTKH